MVSVGVLGVHALIQLMGVFKAFGYVELAQLLSPSHERGPRDCREFGAERLMPFGEARWLPPDGEFRLRRVHARRDRLPQRDAMTPGLVQKQPERRLTLVRVKLLHTAVWFASQGASS